MVFTQQRKDKIPTISLFQFAAHHAPFRDCLASIS